MSHKCSKHRSNSSSYTSSSTSSNSSSNCSCKSSSCTCKIQIAHPKELSLPFLMGRSIVTIANNTAVKDINYQIVGTLSCQFEQNRGIFIAHEPGFYQFFYYVTFQALQSINTGNITVQVDGERRMRLVRSFATSLAGNSAEASFIGQYQYVPNSMLVPASSRAGSLSEQFSTLMSTSATLSMNCGDTVQLSLYQNNSGIQNPPPNVTLPSGPVPITAFIEFTIIKIAEAPNVPSSAVQSISPLQFTNAGLTANNVLLQQAGLSFQNSLSPINLSIGGNGF